jgi:hypothetical protein
MLERGPPIGCGCRATFDRGRVALGSSRGHRRHAVEPALQRRLAARRSVVRASWGRFFQSQRPYQLRSRRRVGALRRRALEHSVLGYRRLRRPRRGPSGRATRALPPRRRRPRPRYENLLEQINFLPRSNPTACASRPTAAGRGVELLVRGGARLDGWLAYSLRAGRGSHRRRGRAALARPATRRDPGPRLSGDRASSLAVAWRYRSGCETTPVRSVLLPIEDRTSSSRSSCSATSTASGSASITVSTCGRAIESHCRQARCSLRPDIQNLYDRANDAGLDVTVDDGPTS